MMLSWKNHLKILTDSKWGGEYTHDHFGPYIKKE